MKKFTLSMLLMSASCVSPSKKTSKLSSVKECLYQFEGLRQSVMMWTGPNSTSKQKIKFTDKAILFRVHDGYTRKSQEADGSFTRWVWAEPVNGSWALSPKRFGWIREHELVSTCEVKEQPAVGLNVYTERLCAGNVKVFFSKVNDHCLIEDLKKKFTFQECVEVCGYK